MASTSSTVTVTFDQKSIRLIERMAKALEESNAIAREAAKPVPTYVHFPSTNPKDETHS